MSAFFHEVGRQRSKKEEFKMSATGAVNKSAFSFNTHEGIPSGPDADCSSIESTEVPINNFWPFLC